jgi:hypothetical protein
MNESKMGNRGSNSDKLKIANSVKEQRVDGSKLLIKNQLRCTLMGYESNYQIKISN